MLAPLAELQQKLDVAILSWCRENESELRDIVSGAQAGIPLQMSNGRLQPVDMSVLPIIADPANIEFARRVVSATLVARFALLSAIPEDDDLRGFLTSGLSEIAREISVANSVPPKFFRGRTDAIMNLRGEPSCHIVEFNGEPLGEHFIPASQKVVFEILERMTGYRPAAERFRHPFDAAFEKFLNAYQKLRLRSGGSLPEKPHFGYFVNRDSSAREPYARLAFQAQSRLQRLESRYGVVGKMFHTSDIEGFSQMRIDGKTIFLPRVGGIDLHVIRWLHDEPFEFETFWRTLRANHPKKYYRFTGVPHPVHNPEAGRCLLAINGFSTFPTDKKFDVILGDRDLHQRFQLASRIEQILRDDGVRKELEVPEDFTKDEIFALIDRGMPETRMLRRVPDGLYPESGADDGYGLSEEDLERLLTERERWVLKLSSLGCSAKGVFVGRAFDVDGLPEDLVSSMPDEQRRQVHEILGKERSEGLARQLSDASMDALRDLLWPALVHHALQRGDGIVQRAIDSRVVDGFFVRAGEVLPKRAEPLQFDYNFMSLGAETLHALFRVTTAEDVTNIVSGRGGIATSIHPDEARDALRAAEFCASQSTVNA